MRVLILAKKRLNEAGITGVRLACCDGERPTFPPSSFEIVAASDVIEHTPSPDAFVAACADLLVPEGLLFLATPNRFSLSLEPHVRLWGVGFLPRRLALWRDARRRIEERTSWLCVRLAMEGCVLSPPLSSSACSSATGCDRRSSPRRCPSPRKASIAGLSCASSGPTTVCVPSR
jgi:SAM-dependent methyltransferase